MYNCIARAHALRVASPNILKRLVDQDRLGDRNPRRIGAVFARPSLEENIVLAEANELLSEGHFALCDCLHTYGVLSHTQPQDGGIPWPRPLLEVHLVRGA